MNTKNSGHRVWLCDLTYTQQTVAADTIPMAVACIAEYTEKKLNLENRITVFKYPEDLCEKLDTSSPPDIVGVCNYCWNNTL